MECYSRDALAAPLRSLVTVLRQVRAGTFRPDETRSGALADEASDSGSSKPSTAPTEAAQTDGEDDVESEGDQPEDYVHNERSGVVHRVLDGEPACGKKCPTHGRVVSSFPVDGVRCRRCF